MAFQEFGPERSGGIGGIGWRLLFQFLVGHKKCTECSHRDHDDSDSGFGLMPKYRPHSVNLVMTIISSSDFYEGRDCSEDTKAQDPPKRQLPTECYFDFPE